MQGSVEQGTHEAFVPQGLPPLPAINVHFFAETTAGEKLFRQVMADRHLRRTHAEVHPGGIMGAVAAYAQAPTPELLVVESSAAPEELFRQLQALAEVVVQGTRVVVVGHVNDLFLYRRLLAEGVHDYLALPMPAEQLITSLSQLFLSDPSAKLGRIITFMSAKGGSGSSTIAHNVSWLLAQEHQINTAVADLDLAFGTAGIDFGVAVAQTVADALSASDRMDEALIDKLLHKCSEHLMLLAAPCSLDEVVPVQEQTLNMMLDILRQLVPLTVLDLPGEWENWMRAAIVQAEKVVLTANLDLAALRNAKILLDSIRKLRPNEAPPLLVINQVGMGKRPEVPVEKFVEAVGAQDFITVPFDEVAFGTAALEGKLVVQHAPDSEAAQALHEIAVKVADLPRRQQREQKSSGLLQSLAPVMEKLRLGTGRKAK